MIDWIKGQGGGLSHLMSLGNQTDVSETDLLPEIAKDPHTKAITLYIEGVKDGRKFIETASEVTRKKPVVALKVGRFESGKRAAASHTGALAGQETAYDAAFEKAGVLRADTTEEMFQWARALAWCPLPAGKRVAVLTNSGGPGVTAADAIEQNHLVLADLTQKTRESLKQFLPAAASVMNPVDMLASATPEQFSASLKLLLEDEGVDSVIVISPPPPPSTIGAIVKAMIPVVQSYPDKPVLFSIMGSEQIGEGVSLLHAMKLPDYRFPEAAASALGALNRYAEYCRSSLPKTESISKIKKNQATASLHNPRVAGWVASDDLLDIMEDYGIQPSRIELATNEAEAVRISGKDGISGGIEACLRGHSA